MKILIDCQALQCSNTKRGIGEYYLSLFEQLLMSQDRNYILLFNKDLPLTIRDEWKRLYEGVSNIQIISWRPILGVNFIKSEREARLPLIRKWYVEIVKRLAPDYILFTSAVEAIYENVLTPFRIDDIPHGTFLFDLIPLEYEQQYLNSEELRREYRSILNSIEAFDQIFTISEASAKKINKYLPKFFGDIVNVSAGWKKDCSTNLVKGNLENDKTIILYVSANDYRKNHKYLIDAYLILPRDDRIKYQLVLAGLGTEVFDDASNNIRGLGYVGREELQDLYRKAVLFVHPSLQEGFGLSVLESIKAKVPLLLSAIEVFKELGLHSRHYFPLNSAYELSAKMSLILNDSKAGVEYIVPESTISGLTWQKSAERLTKAFSYAKANVTNNNNFVFTESDDQYLDCLNSYTSKAFENYSRNLLLIDVSLLTKIDDNKGVTRYIKELCRGFFNLEDKDYKIHFVYKLYNTDGIFLIKDQSKFLNEFNFSFDEPLPETITIGKNSAYLSLDIDLQKSQDGFNDRFLSNLEALGVKTFTVVQDIFPTMPQLGYDKEFSNIYASWLEKTFSESIAIFPTESSLKTAKEYCDRIAIDRKRFGWVRSAHIPLMQASEDDINIRDFRMNIVSADARYALIVGTIEPRKNYEYILDSVSSYLDSGGTLKIVIVASYGHNFEKFVQQFERNKYKDKEIFWYEFVSDCFLKYLYENADAYISASIDEGFSLTVAEANRCGVRLVLSDIPVYRELYDESMAIFFSLHQTNGYQPSGLALALKRIEGMEKFVRCPISRFIPTSYREVALNIVRFINSDFDNSGHYGPEHI